MRTFLSAVCLFCIFGISEVQAEELPKIKAAIVRMNRLMNNEVVNYEQVRMLVIDQESLDMLKKINLDIHAVQKDIMETQDEAALAELGRKLEFLTRKYNLIKQRVVNSHQNDIQNVLRSFIVSNYKDKYHLITQEPEMLDRFFCKQNMEIVDITDDVAAKINETIKEKFGE